MSRSQSTNSLHWQWFVGLAVVGGVAAGAGLTRDRWLPLLESVTPSSAGDDAHEGHAHVEDPHDHAHAGHSAATSLELDDKAGKNIGLKVGVVKPRDYTRTVSVPAMVVERPGRSQVEITAPLTGIVTRVYPLSGEAMLPGEPLFELRLTHEDLVTAQRDFLRSVEELDVVQREIKRLESVGEGVIAGRRVIEQKYEQQKLQAALHAQRQGLLLHGLDDEQINRILETRQLQQTLIVHAPSIEHDEGDPSGEHLFHVQKIVVKRGEHVTAGDTLGVLSDHCLLYVEGQAFEDDADQLVAATRDGTKIRVSPLADQNGDQSPLALSVMYVADHVDQQSRALRFYLSLPNQLVHDRKGPDGRFVAWRYRPGQRMEVRVPIGQAWENQIVLPADAVVQEGAETFVFEQNGKHFDRVAVHVLIRDKDAVVVENDGSLVGSSLAMSGAYQMHLAIKNKSGGAIDPHAGHNH